MRSRIYLIRHGITEGNLRKWFYGSADIPLTEKGIAELKRLAEKRVYPRIDEDADCYTTGLLRTEQTFEILFGKRQRKVIAELQEMNFGRYECHSYEELKDDAQFSAWCWDESGDAPLDGGETRNQFGAERASGISSSERAFSSPQRQGYCVGCYLSWRCDFCSDAAVISSGKEQSMGLDAGTGIWIQN